MKSIVCKAFAVLTAVCLLCCAVPLSAVSTVSADEEDADLVFGDYEYRVLWDGTVAITGYLKDEKGVTASIPATIEGRAVTTIAEEAFEDARHIHHVEIPEGVVTIERSAFKRCRWMETLTLPSTLKTIDASAFNGCKALTQVEFPSSLERIEAYAFEDTAMEEFDIPASVTYIGDAAFGETKYIRVSPDNPKWCDVDGVLFSKDKTLLKSYPSGRKDAFYTVPDGVIDIAGEAFKYADLKVIDLPQGLETIGDYAFHLCFALSSIQIPETVTSIDDGAFEGCAGLTNMRLPTALERLGSGAFTRCYSLHTVTIPVGLTDIFSETFYGCEALTDVHYEGTQAQWSNMQIGPSNQPLKEATVHDSSVGGAETVGTDYIYSVRSDGTVRLSTYIGNETTVIIPAQIDGRAVTVLGRDMFAYTSPETVIVPEGVTHIETSAFGEMANLVSLSFPSTLQSIGQKVVDWNTERGEPLTLKEVLYSGDEAMWAQIEIPDPLYASSPFGDIEIQYGVAPEQAAPSEDAPDGAANTDGGFPWGALIAVAAVAVVAAVVLLILKKRR